MDKKWKSIVITTVDSLFFMAIAFVMYKIVCSEDSNLIISVFMSIISASVIGLVIWIRAKDGVYSSLISKGEK